MANNNYVTNIPKSPLGDVCPEPPDYINDTDLMTMYRNGVASDILVPDESTGRVPVAQLQSHVQNLQGSGVLKPRPTILVAGKSETDMSKLLAQDTELFNGLREEYCYYEQRYRYALKIFLQKATSREGGDNNAARAMLNNTKLLNVRVNSVLEVMNYLAQARAPVTNENKDRINEYNQSILDKLKKAQNMYNLLKRDNAMIVTQREMVRYTAEKNNYTTNKITLWASLNLIALATIFYVYRN
jgi:hypothetical protein